MVCVRSKVINTKTKRFFKVIKCIINKAMIKSYKRGKSLFVVKRYLKIKHKINISLNTLLKRFKKMKDNYILNNGISNCCCANVLENTERCSKCGENCEVISDEETH